MDPEEDPLTKIAFALMATDMPPSRFSILLLSSSRAMPQHQMYDVDISRAGKSISAYTLITDGLAVMTYSDEDRRLRFLSATHKGHSVLRPVFESLMEAGLK